MAKKAGKSGQLNLRVESELLDRLEDLAEKLSRPGATMSRSDAARAALLEGLAKLEAEGFPRRK